MFWSDRPGHNRRAVGRVARGLAALAILLFPGRAAAAAKDYSAQRFDVQMAVERGGDLRVTETVTFDFSAGPFTRIWRVIPSNRTDGIEILDASMDGRPWPVGDGVGHITVTGDNRVRVEWHFAPVSTSTHTFGLTYRARGVAVATTAGDIVEWKPLPTEHAYRIARTSVVITSPLATDDARIVDVRGIEGPSSIEAGDGSANANIERIRANGNLTLSLRYPRGSVATTQPRWQVREERRAAAAPRWVLSAGAVFAAIMVLVLALRRSEGPPPQVAPIEQVVDRVPEAMAPALSAALVNNGHPTGAAAMATLLDLADRGVVAIRELPRHFGVRNFELSQVPGRHELSGHEAAAVSIAFAGAGDPVTLSKARARLARRGRQFSAAVVAELTAMGMLDEPRTVAASRLKMVGLTLLIGGAMLVIPAVMLVNVYGQWPLMIPLAIGAGRFRRHHRGSDDGGPLGDRTDPRGAMARLSTVSEEHRRGS